MISISEIQLKLRQKISRITEFVLQNFKRLLIPHSTVKLTQTHSSNSMDDIDTLYSDTEGYVKNLETTYLSKHIALKTSSPTDYNNDVKSFCILSHAALEEFAETIAITVMDKTVDNFVNRHKITEPLVALMHFKSNGDAYLSKSEDDDKIETITSYDYIRLRLVEIKNRFSKEVFNNH